MNLNGNEEYLKEVTLMLKCIVMSAKEDITILQLDEDFHDLQGYSIPYDDLGFSRLESLIRDMKDTLTVDPYTKVVKLVVKREADKSSHIRHLVQMQPSIKEMPFNQRQCTRRQRFYPKISAFYTPPSRSREGMTNNDICAQPQSLRGLRPRDLFVTNHIQLYAFTIVNRRRGITVEDLKTELDAFLDFTVDHLYGNIYKMLERLGHLMYIRDHRVYPNAISFSPEFQRLGLEPDVQGKLVPFITERMKAYLVELVEKYPQGVWFYDIPHLYEETFRFRLDYDTLGYVGLINMLMEVPECFKVVQIKFNYRVYDARNPYPPEKGVPPDVVDNVKKLLESWPDGMPIRRFPDKYMDQYCTEFCHEVMEFPSLKEALRSLNAHGVMLVESDNGECVIKLGVSPAETASVALGPEERSSLNPLVILEGRQHANVHSGTFQCPHDVMGFGDGIPHITFPPGTKRHGTLSVVVADVYGPHHFYCHLYENHMAIFDMKQAMRLFYLNSNDDYVMPLEAIRCGMYCVDIEDPSTRCVIVDRGKTDDEVVVLMLDYGRAKSAKCSSLHFLHKTFGNLPSQAFLCSLCGLAPPAGEESFSDACSLSFTDFVKDRRMLVYIASIDHKNVEVAVSLVDTDDGFIINVNDMLIDEKYAQLSVKTTKKETAIIQYWEIYRRNCQQTLVLCEPPSPDEIVCIREGI